MPPIAPLYATYSTTVNRILPSYQVCVEDDTVYAPLHAGTQTCDEDLTLYSPLHMGTQEWVGFGMAAYAPLHGGRQEWHGAGTQEYAPLHAGQQVWPERGGSEAYTPAHCAKQEQCLTERATRPYIAGE